MSEKENDEFIKPSDWPCNKREMAEEMVDKALNAFRKDPNFKTREVLVSASAVYDFGQLSSIGRFRITPYEIRLLNTLWLCARYYNISSLLMFVYTVVSELSQGDRMIRLMSGALQQNGMKFPLGDWQAYKYLHKPLLLYYLAYDDYRSRKTGDFGKSLINVTEKSLEGVSAPELICDIARSFVVALSDLSCMMGSKREGMLKLSRSELSAIFQYEAELLKRSGQRPGERPLSSQLKVQISNYILKSRHGYNEDLICKYIEPQDLLKAHQNEQVWIHKISELNDPEEGSIIDRLFEDDSWTGFPWAKNIQTHPSRTYFVVSFSKSKDNDDAKRRYGPCILGYKGDRLIDLLAPICDTTMYRAPDADKNLPETRIHTSLTQVLAFDVLYDFDAIKEELQYLCSVIDFFDMASDEKKCFLESMVQYWRYSAKVPDPKWVAERERRYVLFTYPDVSYRESEADDKFFKFKTSLYLYPDLILGAIPNREAIKARIDEKRQSIFYGEYFFCHNCLNRDFDLVFRVPLRCPVCGSTKFEICKP